MTRQIAVRLSKHELTALDEAVSAGDYPSRAAAVRAALDLLRREDRNRRIGEEYRRAYSEQPQDDWFAEASAEAMGESLKRRSSQA